MKTITQSIFKSVLLIIAYCSMPTAFAQAPGKMSYQAVIRNASNVLITNQAVGMRISVLQGSASGTAVYVETQTPTTNINGLVSLEIGSGTVVSGTFSSINWANGPYFIRTQTDPTGGTSYTITGTSQLLSVPYALYAASGPTGSANINGTTNYLTKFTGATTGGNSQIYDNGTFVGFGTTAPMGSGNYRFHQTVSGNNWGGIYVSTSSATGRPFYGFGNGINQLGWIEMDGGDGNKMNFHNVGKRMTITNNGNIGIGNSDPLYSLHVVPNGTSNVSTVVAASNAAGTVNGIIRADYTGSAPNFDHVGLVGSVLYNGSTGFGVGVRGDAGWIGVFGRGNNTSNNVTYGGRFFGSNNNGTAYGVNGTASNNGTIGGTKYGVVGSASGGTTNYGVYCIGNGGHTGTWTNVSDRNLKQNIRPFGSALDRVMQLNVYSYEFKKDDPKYAAMHLDGGTHHGFISQELEEVMPELVRNDILVVPSEDREAEEQRIEYKGINYTEMIPVLTKAIQEQQDLILVQQNLIQELSARVKTLENNR